MRDDTNLSTIPVLSLFVAALALLLNYCQSQDSAEERAALVRPYIEILVKPTSDRPDEWWEIELTNLGLGPAYLQEMEVRVDGKTITKDAWDNWGKLQENYKIEFAQFGGFESTPVLSPKESVVVFTTDPKTMNRLEFNIEFCSAFQECTRCKYDPEDQVYNRCWK